MGPLLQVLGEGFDPTESLVFPPFKVGLQQSRFLWRCAPPIIVRAAP